MVVVCSFIGGLVTFVRFVCDSGHIEPLGFQPSSTQEGLRVCHLNNPRASRPFRAIEQRAFTVNVKKYFLDKIVRLGFVPENPLADVSDEMGIASEE
jgi:hypothetical protein